MNNIPNPTIDYWMQLILPYTKNSYSPTNTDGWTYRINTPDNKLYEKDTIDDYVQDAVTEYSGATTYKYGEYAREVSGLKVYKSLTNNNLGNVLTNTNYWYLYTTLATETDEIWQPTFGDQVEKARILNIEKTNIYNIIQTLAEKFQVQVSFEYTYDTLYQVATRNIVFSQEVVTDEIFSINYGINSNNISRTVDTNDLVTKIYVEPIDSEFEETTGLLTIQNAPQNIAMESFIYNFNYLKDVGEITQTQYNNMVTLLSNLRIENIRYNKAALNYLALSDEYETIITQLEFLKYQLPAIQKTINSLLKEEDDYSEDDQPTQITDKMYTIKNEAEGIWSINVSSQKGAIAGTFTIKILAPTE